MVIPVSFPSSGLQLMLLTASLSDNSIGDCGARAVAHAAESMPCLEEIMSSLFLLFLIFSLAGCEIYDSSPLLEIAKSHPAITSLV